MNLGRLIKLAVSVLYYVKLQIERRLRSLVGKTRAECVVLYYHAFAQGTGDAFGKQLDLIKRTTMPVAAGETLNKTGRFTAITIDDGFQNVIDVALPELHSRSIPATIFVIADGFGRCLDWSDEFYDWYRTQRIMTEETMCSLPTDSVTIGSHTLTHPLLTMLPRTKAEDEIRNSRNKLERILGRSVTLFSFPHGEYNPELIEICRKAGYDRVFTTDPTITSLGADDFVIGRVTVEPTDWPIEFRLKLLGAYSWLRVAVVLKKKLFGKSKQ
jgi:peptidoglycan/xylan/chitin deacetylase (PgdA/CDA1 family)